MKTKPGFYSISGIIAIFLYIGFAMIGAFITPDYSSISKTISELHQAGAPHKFLLDVGFSMSNVLMAVFGYGLYRIGRRDRNKFKSFTGITLAAGGIMAFIMVMLFPADAYDMKLSISGFMHHFIVGILTVLAMLSIHFSDLAEKQSKIFKIYSNTSILLFFFLAVWTAFSGATSRPFTGLLERVTIGVFIQWMFVIALSELRNSTSFETEQRIYKLKRNFGQRIRKRFENKQKGTA